MVTFIKVRSLGPAQNERLKCEIHSRTFRIQVKCKYLISLVFIWRKSTEYRSYFRCSSLMKENDEDGMTSAGRINRALSCPIFFPFRRIISKHLLFCSGLWQLNQTDFRCSFLRMFAEIDESHLEDLANESMNFDIKWRHNVNVISGETMSQNVRFFHNPPLDLQFIHFFLRFS